MPHKLLTETTDGLQVTKDELQTAMTFLKAQLGEEELRMLLERMDSFNDDTKIDVKQLMALAEGKTAPEKVQKANDQNVTVHPAFGGDARGQ